MKTRVISLFFLLGLVLQAGAQDRVLSHIHGYELRMSTLEPAIELLEFLVQGKVSFQEKQLIVRESIEEFETGPEELLQSMNELQAALQLVRSKNDPTVLGEFRQQMLAEFHIMSQSMPANEMPAYLNILNEKAPVVAFDPNTKVALTQQDLVSALLYMRKLGAMKGENWSDEELIDAAKEVLGTFQQIEPDMQKLLASGTLLESLYSANMNRMSSQQKVNVTNHYRQTVGGPPSQSIVTRGSEAEPSAYQRLSRSGPDENKALLNSLKSAGGETDYWKAVAK